MLAGWLAAAAHADTLSPGSDAPACNNVVIPGPMTRCVPMAVAPASEHPTQANESGDASGASVPDAPAPGSAGASEAAIDAYLANFGKPPRTAVRALLDPSEENIAALAAEQRKRRIVADYVALRLIRMQAAERLHASKPALDAHTVLPLFAGVQVSAYVTPDCRGCAAAVESLHHLVQMYPVTDARLVVVARQARGALDLLLRAGASLPVVSLSPQAAAARGLQRFPLVEIIDNRSGERRRILGAPEAAALREMVIALRRHTPAPAEAH